MTKLSKFIYAMMLAVSLITITIDLIKSNYDAAIMAAATLLWVGVAFIMELRCIKLQKQIDELNGTN
jgi:ABC-type sulfate transport system permease component